MGKLMDMAKSLVNIELPFPAYGTMAKILFTGPGPPHTQESLTHIDCYMDDVTYAVQGGPKQQHLVFDCTVHALKWLSPSVPGESKDSVSVKKLLAGEGDWICAKEVLGCTVDMEAGTVTFPEHKLWGILTLLDIPVNQRRIGRKELERMVGKLLSMHLAVPGAVAHLFYIQQALV